MLTDGRLHNLNQTLAGRPQQDLGRYAHTRLPEDWGRFKTPPLRNLRHTAPWFHHGRFTNLGGIVALYNLGMPQRLPADAPAEARQPRLDPLIRPLGLTREEREALVRFLETL